MRPPENRVELYGALRVVGERVSQRWGAGVWGLMGGTEAAETWVGSSTQRDLDIWCRDALVAEEFSAALREFGGVRASGPAKRPRIDHRSWWVAVGETGALVDLTVGDLGVGNLRVVPAARVSVKDDEVSGEAKLFLLLAKPLLRGKLPSEDAVIASREVLAGGGLRGVTEWPWSLRRGVRAVFGRSRRRWWPLVGRSLVVWATVRHPVASWSGRHEILGREKSGATGLAARGVVVAFIGVDGAGKSTLAESVEDVLTGHGCRVEGIYMGMARENIKIVRALRGAYGAEATEQGGVRESGGGVVEVRSRREKATRWAGAWLYGADLAVRVVKARRLARRGAVVLADRWVYDLEMDPSPGHWLGRLMRRVVPDLLIFCHGETLELWERKREGSRDRLDERQDQYRAAARDAERRGVPVIWVETTGDSGRGSIKARTADLARAVLAVSHRTEVEL